MGFVCLELVPIKEPLNPLHPQPPSYGSLAIVLIYFLPQSMLLKATISKLLLKNVDKIELSFVCFNLESGFKPTAVC